MKQQRLSVKQLLRFDWAIYLVLVGGLLCVFGVEFANATSLNDQSLEQPEAAAVVFPMASLSIGAVYSLIVLVVIPVTAFIIVNLRASRQFRARVAGQSEVPTVEAKVPMVTVKSDAENSQSTRV